MTYYESQKKELVRDVIEFDLNDNLLSLIKMMQVGHKILKDNDCEELFTKLTSNKSLKSSRKPKIDL